MPNTVSFYPCCPFFELQKNVKKGQDDVENGEIYIFKVAGETEGDSLMGCI
ncbi:MAG: hypothetical protein KA143_06405 [Saprospiraceae bacterium]|nr:hypothetical protein [Saprospiraceae bacterium]